MPTVEIIPFSQPLKPYFESINKAWVVHYFSLEPFDIDQLENPEETILAKGGAILFAKMGDEIVGTVGLVPVEKATCEMIKMGVSPAAQGNGVGLALGKALMEQAKAMGFSKMVLYSNTVLAAALHLYEKIGFQKVDLECGAYGRCNVKMEAAL
ncbi:GNAT family N-acetyltransferase [Algoriphagus terrigena]|uniref:GNAT family N-acetyltransferase n=1 Tax=Algoriphagus terrigena TaxID=344884 RepID=UPI000408859D|nr:GNAT family N-acetyltransferase [Algoriphagus terrigena]